MTNKKTKKKIKKIKVDEVKVDEVKVGEVKMEQPKKVNIQSPSKLFNLQTPSFPSLTEHIVQGVSGKLFSGE